MKISKKLLYVICLSALLFLCFVLTANAQNRVFIDYTDASGITHQVPIIKFDDATPESVASAIGYQAKANMLKYFVDDSAYTILKADDGSLCAYPTWYLIEQSGSSSSYIAISEIRYGYINSKVQDKSYSNGAILYTEFPNGMTHIRNNGVFGRNTGYERNVTDIYIPASVVEIQSGSFQASTSLTRVFFEEGSLLERISDDAFIDCFNLQYFEFEKLTKLTFIDGFNNCKGFSGTKIDLSSNAMLIEIGSNCFRNCGLAGISLPDSIKKLNSGVFYQNNLQNLKLPVSLEYIGDDVFTGNTNMVLENGILPKNLCYVGINFLAGCSVLPSVIVFPEGVTVIPDEGFPNVTTPEGKGNLTIVFLGKMTKVVIDGSDYSAWAEHVTIYFAKNSISDFNGKIYSYTDKVTGTLGSYVSQSGSLTLDVSDRSPSSTSQVGTNFMELIFCGENGKIQQSYMLTRNGDSITEDRGLYDFDGHSCQLYYADYSDCTSNKICFVCDTNYAEASHNYNIKITYAHGFLTEGIKSQACQNPQCLVATEGTSVKAIFITLGISVSAFGDTQSITQGFKINADAYNDYVSAGNSLSYGLLAGLASITTSTPLEIKDGHAMLKNGCRGVIVSQNSISLHSYFELKIVGITEANYNTELVLNAFVVDNGSVYYLSENIQDNIVIPTSYALYSE